MSTIVFDETEVQEQEADWVPVGHIASLEWLLSDRTERPTIALCGASILGIPADTEHVKCEDCREALYALTDHDFDRVTDR